MGLFPGPILRKMDASVARYIEGLRTKPSAAVTMNLSARPSPEGTVVSEPER